MAPGSAASEAAEGVVALLLDDLAPPRLGTLLRGARKQHGMSRRDAAERVGTTASELRRYERGEVPVPASIIAGLAECYGADLTDQLAARVPVRVGRDELMVGREHAGVDASDGDAVLETYARLVARVRHAQPGEPIALRADDLVALSSALGSDAQEIEARIVDLLGCTPREARSLHAEMLRRKLVVPVAGLVAGLAVVTGVGVAAAAAAPGPVTPAPANIATITAAPATTTTELVPVTTTTVAALAPAAADHAAAPPTETPATEVPATTEATATESAGTATPAAQATHDDTATTVPRPVITPDTTPMSIPDHETVTIIQP